MKNKEHHRKHRWHRVLEIPAEFPTSKILYRNAPKIAVVLGILVAISIYMFGDTAWWMPLFLGMVIVVVINRIMRPKKRSFNIEDEI